MIHPKILHNDRIVSAGDAVLSPGQLGLLSGWGVFSTIRVSGGVLFAFGRHWARMKRDAQLMRVPFPANAVAVEQSLLQLIAANGVEDATLRVAIVRNRGGFWEGQSNARDYDVIALTADINSWGNAVRLGVVAQARHSENVFAGTKILSWAQNLAWYEAAHEEGFDEVVLLNERDEVAECTSANIFAASGDTVYTPPLSSGCLPGITRNLLLEEVRVAGISVQERVLRLEDLERADQVFITSTTRGVLPVSYIDGLEVQSRGDVAARLGEAFEQHVQDYVAKHKVAAGV